jgi:hypothetical protein
MPDPTFFAHKSTAGSRGGVGVNSCWTGSAVGDTGDAAAADITFLGVIRPGRQVREPLAAPVAAVVLTGGNNSYVNANTFFCSEIAGT